MLPCGDLAVCLPGAGDGVILRHRDDGPDLRGEPFEERSR
jgi:hypothetical protein